MKTHQKQATSKLVNRFDRELMNILMSDLKTIKTKKQAAQLIHLIKKHTTLNTSTMKTYKTATSKLVARFDNELKNLLMEDLKAFKDRTQFTSNKQKAVQQLSAA